MEFQLLFHEKEKYLMTSQKEIVIEMKLFLALSPFGKEFPEGCKFNWIAFNKHNPKEKVLFDNHEGKGPHYHIDNQSETFFTWISLTHATTLFYQKITERFGDFA